MRPGRLAMSFTGSWRHGCAVRGDRPVTGAGEAGDRVKTDRRDAEKLARVIRIR